MAPRCVGDYNRNVNAVASYPGILDGTPVFRGTRVPVQTLFDYIQGGDTLDDFLTDFPSVAREQVSEFLEAARNSLIASVD